MIEDLDKKERGIFHFTYYILFLLLYFYIIVSQRNLSLSHSIDASIRLLTEGFDAVGSSQDVFNYLELLAMNNYNGNEPESPCNSCELFNDSSLGYVPSGYPELWQCNRTLSSNDTLTDFNDPRCSIYSHCFSEKCENFNESVAAPVQWSGTYDNIGLVDVSVCSYSFTEFLRKIGVTKTIRNIKLNRTTDLGSEGWLGNMNKHLGGYVLLFGLKEESACTQTTSTRQTDAYITTCYDESDLVKTNINVPTEFIIESEVEYNYEAGGYALAFDGGFFNNGPYFTLCGMEWFKNSRIFLQQLKFMEIMFYTYNAEDSGVWSLTNIRYDFDEGGEVTSKLKIHAFPLRNMYQFISGTGDGLRLFLEILFLICVCGNTFGVLKSIHKDYNMGRWDRVHWLLIRLLSVIFFWVQVFYWLKVADDMATTKLTLIDGLSNATIHTIITNVTKMVVFSTHDAFYNQITVINGVLALFVVFYTLSFHKQLSVVTDTIFGALMNLFHFMIIFMCILVLFSAICYICLGPHDVNFRTMKISFESLALVILGQYDYYGWKAISNPLGPVIFFMYQLIVTLLMLNIFLSIVLDSYSSIKTLIDDAQHTETIFQTLLNIYGRLQGRFMIIFCKTKDASDCSHAVVSPETQEELMETGDECEAKSAPSEEVGTGNQKLETKSSFRSVRLLSAGERAMAVDYVRALRNMSVAEENKAKRHMVPLLVAKQVIACSPASERTCQWYLQQYICKKLK